MLSLKEALRLHVIAQKGIQHKPHAETGAYDEGVQLAFNQEFDIGVAEAEELRFDLAHLLLL